MEQKKKLSFTTLGCPDWSFERILGEAHQMGFSGIEIRGIEGKMSADEIPQFYPKNRDATLESLKVHKLEIVCFGSSVALHDAGKFNDMITEGKRTISELSAFYV